MKSIKKYLFFVILINLSAFNLLTPTVAVNQEKDQLIAYINKLRNSSISGSDSTAEGSGLDKFRTLVERSEEYTEEIKAAQSGVNNKDAETQKAALSLFIEVVKKGKGYKEAFQASQNKINTLNAQKEALDLLTALVEQGQNLDKAPGAIKIGLSSKNTSILTSTLFLSMALVDKGTGVNEALNLAKALIKNTDKMVQMGVLMLLTELVKKGQGLAEALQAANTRIIINDTRIQKLALELFCELVKKGQGVDKAINAIMIGVNKNVMEPALALLNTLFNQKNNQGFSTILTAAKTRINNSDSQTQVFALYLFIALVKKNQFVDEAIKIVKDKITSQNPDIQKIALALQHCIDDTKIKSMAVK